MGEVKDVNVKNQTLILDDMVDISSFHSNFLKIDKKSHIDIEVHYWLHHD